MNFTKVQLAGLGGMVHEGTQSILTLLVGLSPYSLAVRGVLQGTIRRSRQPAIRKFSLDCSVTRDPTIFTMSLHFLQVIK